MALKHKHTEDCKNPVWGLACPGCGVIFEYFDTHNRKYTIPDVAHVPTCWYMHAYLRDPN